VKINTAQNVRIDLKTASISDRLLALFIDYLIILAYLYVILQIIGLEVFDNLGESIGVLSIVLLPVMFYHLILELILNGQSLGKKLLGIKVVKAEGGAPNMAAFLLRWLFRLVDFTITMGLGAFVSYLFSRKGQRIGDMVAGTSVIRVQDHTEFLKRYAGNKVPEDYQPVFEEASKLTMQHVKLMERAIKVKLELLNEKPVVTIAQKLKDYLEIKSDMPDLKLLHTLIKDYYYYASREEELHSSGFSSK